ncbi:MULTISPECIES: F0F1 ATP synthase subunit B [unclassified Streptococcus]|uniref:F0F1 ATP synthase subunit B n=1 Tax=unclassified Streptococcus TaxID=2608887 RepID=UPI0011B511A5|nr:MULTISPECIES: F0F1 ATP synthase subunit B [unclassified Streptococcus]TWS95524.1 F0F1 ATP synthase subunit B [Streptococcus sp. sy018]TWT16649.1 F0F1 ATP synthase subunit B [Streptococcus sp. sy010]
MSLLFNATSLGNIIITLGSILLLVVLIKKFSWQQLTAVFKEREEKIAQDIDGAETARRQAEIFADKRQAELATARQEAGRIIDSAKETGALQGAKIIEQAEADAKQLKEQAEQDIIQSKTEALADIKGEISDLTVALAEKMMLTQLDQQKQSQLIDQYLEQLGE